MDARLTPSNPITTYDPSDDQETLQELGALYDRRLLKYRGRVIVILLARAFVSGYGQWISHRGLRHVILTHLCGPDTTRSQIHALQAYQHLQQKLNSPSEIDDADLCMSFLLALCRSPRSSLRIHAEGTLAIMKHLSKRNLTCAPSTPLSTLRPLIRDELISEALIWDAGGYMGLREGFEEVLGPENIHQRKTYKRDISFGDCDGPVRNYVDLAGSAYQSETIVLYCHWRILRFRAFGAGPIDPFILSILGDTCGSMPLWEDVDVPPLDPNFQNLPELVKEYQGTTSQHARKDYILRAICNLNLYQELLRLSTTVLSATSICEGLRLKDSFLAMMKLRDLFLQIEKAFQPEQIGKTFNSRPDTNTLSR